jgi:hypothetical protein
MTSLASGIVVDVSTRQIDQDSSLPLERRLRRECRLLC